MTTTRSRGNRWALGGVLFAACFTAGDILGGTLATVPLPLPSAPAAEVAHYYDASRVAVLAVGACQTLAALALLAFVAPVTAFVRRIAGERGALSRLTVGAGLLAAGLLLACAALSWARIPIAAGGDLAWVGTLGSLNFLAGGTLHIAALGLFIGTASFAARRVRALPRWLVWWGSVMAVPALLSLLSLAAYYANALIPLGRLLGFVWCIAVGIVLARDARRAPATPVTLDGSDREGSERRVLA